MYRAFWTHYVKAKVEMTITTRMAHHIYSRGFFDGTRDGFQSKLTSAREISILHWSQWSSIFLLSISIIEILKLMQINAICKIFGILHFYLCICSFSTYFKDVYIKTLTVYRSAPSQLSILIDYIRYISINKPNINMYLQDLQIARPSTHCER